MSSFGPDRKAAARPQEVLPASQYLHERLQERRARNMRPRGARHTDIGPIRARDDDIFINEARESRGSRTYDMSPLAFNGRSSYGATTSSGGNRRHALGIKEMDKHLDRLNKQNFDLKLELDHRRDHTAKLQEQIEAMKEQVERAQIIEDEHAELIRINLQMVEELEKRDKAVEEAVDIIRDLEAKVTELEDGATETRPSTANADSGYAGTEMHEQVPPSSPPEMSRIPRTPAINVRRPSEPASAASHKLQGIEDGKTPARSKREPMVLSHQKPTTQALRSVYLENSKQLHPVKSFHSLLSRRESMLDDDIAVEDVPNSPRLSVLSESSFPSIYSSNKKKLSPERLAWESREHGDATLSPSESRAHFRQNSIKRVNEWISERDAVSHTPSKSNKITVPLIETEDLASPAHPLPPPPHASVQEHYRSLNDALNAVASGPSELSHSQSMYGHFDRPAKKSQKPRPTSFAGPIFGEPMLPPTPDSVSTRMLRASRSSINDEKSLLDTTPAPVRGFAALEPGLRTAPRQMRSSVELNTAFASNLNFRNAGLGNARDDSSSEGEDELDARSLTVRDFGLDYDGFPDGQSILMGTPSRFLKHSKPPAESIMFDGHDISSPEAARSPPPPPRRRRSSAEVPSSTAKPRLHRTETSPGIFETLGRIVGAGPKTSLESVTSPKSSRSGSSGNRTIVQMDDHQSFTIPVDLPRSSRLATSTVTSPSRTRPSPSPARTLSQKTHMLLRRLSNSTGSDRPEKPPLPQLTATPPTAYANFSSPFEPRRPRTSGGSSDHNPRPTAAAMAQAYQSKDQRRPSVPARNMGELFASAPATPAAGMPEEFAAASDRKPLFWRPQTVRPAEELESPLSGNKGPTGRRRGSLKDAVTAGRRWR